MLFFKANLGYMSSYFKEDQATNQEREREQKSESIWGKKKPQIS